MVRAASTPMTSPRCRRPRIRPSRLGLAHLGCLSFSRLHSDICSILYTDIYSTPEKWYAIVDARMYIYIISPATSNLTTAACQAWSSEVPAQEEGEEEKEEESAQPEAGPGQRQGR